MRLEIIISSLINAGLILGFFHLDTFLRKDYKTICPEGQEGSLWQKLLMFLLFYSSFMFVHVLIKFFDEWRLSVTSLILTPPIQIDTNVLGLVKFLETLS